LHTTARREIREEEVPNTEGEEKGVRDQDETQDAGIVQGKGAPSVYEIRVQPSQRL
jgi:hypothetical protein